MHYNHTTAITIIGCCK